jgi:hypothetical protein
VFGCLIGTHRIAYSLASDRKNYSDRNITMKHEIQPFLSTYRPNPVHQHKLFSQAHPQYGIFGLFADRSEEEEIGRKVGFLAGSIGATLLFTQNKHLKKQSFFNKFFYIAGIGQTSKLIGGYIGKKLGG